MKKAILVSAIMFGALALGGCLGGGTSATKDEESSFKNPSKNPPAAMSESMNRASQQAANAQKTAMDAVRKAQQGAR